MGTRASFFIGDPQNTTERVWLGCIAFDGYPDGDCSALQHAKTADEFRAAIQALAHDRDDFCDTAKQSFPFPWRDDLFLTDYTYAFFDNAVRVTAFHSGFIPLADFLDEAKSAAYEEQRDKLPSNVPAPESQKPPGPDSIMIFGAA